MESAITLRQGQMAISPQPALQRIGWLLGLLTVLAEARGADVSAEGMELYAATLSAYADDDLLVVLQRAARSKRAEGEKAWPTLGDLTERLERLQDQRAEQKRQERMRQADITLFWQIARERLEDDREFCFNGIAYRSLDDVNRAPTRYRGTLLR